MNVIKWFLMEVSKVLIILAMWVSPLAALKMLNCKECLWMFPISMVSTYIVASHYSYVVKVEELKEKEKEISNGKQ